MASGGVTDGECRRSRRTAKSDPLLEREALFSREINATLVEELPLQCRGAYFTRANMPAHWLEAILENQESYRRREKSVALDFRELPSSIVAEFAWSIERQAQLGMRVSAQYTTKLARQIALVLTDPHHACISSLLDLPRDEWPREISRIRIETGSSLAAHQVRELATVLGRILDLLVHAYHRGEWWHPDVWNPLLDTRIPLREHEPLRHSVVNFSHLTTPWLRAAAKWWLSRQLERQVYTWSTIHTRQKNLVWFQNYLELNGHDGPCIVDDQTHLGPWVQGFRRWVARQKARTGPAKGSTISAVQRRAAMTAPEQLYRFLFEEQHAAAHSLDEPRWLRLQPQHAVLFRFGDKPSGPKTPPPDAVLSDAVISRIAEHSDLLGRAKVEGGFGDDQLVRILGLLIQTGRRVREITALSYDPLLAVPFPDLNGHAARLRYQQTKIITDDSTILVDQEIVDLIRKQQDYALAFMSRQGKADLKPKYLFLARNQNRNGDRPYPMSLLHIRLRQFSDRIDLRDEQGNRVRISKTHTFRHTRATNLLNAGVPLHVAMRYMGHKSPAMFLHYAQTLAATAEREFLRYKKVMADGREYERDPVELFEALALDERSDRILPNGYCTLPPRQACDKGNACLSCTKFVTDASFADALARQRDETHQLIEKRQAVHIKRFGEPMTGGNIWLSGRMQEIAALDRILLATELTRGNDRTALVRGAGAPQQQSTTARQSSVRNQEAAT